MSRIGGVGGGGAVQPEDVGGEPEPIAPARTSIRPPVPRDNFAAFRAQRIAIAMDGGPAFMSGLLRRGVVGKISEDNGTFTFVREVQGQPEPTRGLTAREKTDLANALEQQIADGGGGVSRRDLQYFVTSLRESVSGGVGGGGEPDLPGPILTRALGEMGRAVAGMVADRLKNENDAGLERTLKAFIARGGQAPREDFDFSTMVRALADRNLLDDLAQELAVSENELVTTHPNARIFGMFQQMSRAVQSFGSAEAKEAWKKASDLAQRNLGTPKKDARAAGLEVARELTLAVEKGDPELLLRAATKLAKGLEQGSTMGSFGRKLEKGRLNAAIQRLAEDGKLDDVVEALAARPVHDAPVINSLHEAIREHGSAKTKSAWNAAEGREIPRVTTMMVGEEGR